MDGVAAGIHEGAPGELVLVADVLKARQREALPGLHPLDRAELPALDDLEHAGGQRVVAVVECLDDDPARAPRDGGDLAGFGGVAREGLLAQDRLAGLERPLAPLGVQAVREGVVNRLDLAVLDEGVVGVVDPLDPVLGGEGTRSRGVAGGDTCHRGFGHAVRRSDEGGRGDAGCPEYADAQAGHRGPIVLRRLCGGAAEMCAEA